MHCITLCKNCQLGKAIQKLISLYFLSKRFFVKDRYMSKVIEENKLTVINNGKTFMRLL